MTSKDKYWNFRDTKDVINQLICKASALKTETISDGNDYPEEQELILGSSQMNAWEIRNHTQMHYTTKEQYSIIFLHFLANQNKRKPMESTGHYKRKKQSK